MRKEPTQETNTQQTAKQQETDKEIYMDNKIDSTTTNKYNSNHEKPISTYKTVRQSPPTGSKETNNINNNNIHETNNATTKPQKRKKRPNRKERKQQAIDISQFITSEPEIPQFIGYDHRIDSKNKYKKQQYFRTPLTTEEYVMAKFSFVLRGPSQVDERDQMRNMIHNMNPNKLVEWDDIEWMRYHQIDQGAKCTLCLEMPTVPKVTRCGHIFCLPCIYHYLYAVEDEEEYDWRTCPECKESICFDDLKSLKIHYCQPIKKKQVIQLRLVSRPKRSMYGRRMPEVEEREAFIQHIQDDPINIPEAQSKDADLCRYNITYTIAEQLNQEQTAMETKMAIEEMNTVEQAVFSECQATLRKREEEWENYTKNNVVNTYPSFVSTITKQSKLPNETTKEYGLDVYYQAEDGQYFFLHPVQLEMMRYEHHYNIMEYPTRIKAKIVDLERFVVDDENQYQYNCFKTIARNATVSFVELNLKFSTRTTRKFKKELANRKRRRIYLEKREASQAEALKERQVAEEARRRAILKELHEDYTNEPIPDVMSSEIFPEVSIGIAQAKEIEETKNREKKTFWSKPHCLSTDITQITEAFPTLTKSKKKRNNKKNHKKKQQNKKQQNKQKNTESAWGTPSTWGPPSAPIIEDAAPSSSPKGAWSSGLQF